MRILVTGGAGFIGSRCAKRLAAAGDEVVVLDKLTYSGNRANLEGADVEFVQGDVADRSAVTAAAEGCEAILNFAAETHVDRSILGAAEFIETDVLGTYVLLDRAREHGARFVQVSTDEVYGDVQAGDSSKEEDPLRPSNPYSASKAGGDLLALSYWRTHGVPVVITRSSNNFGPYQYPEKVVPLFITNAIDDQPLPLYGDGRNVRDWLYVLDNCAAIDLVLRRGRDGEVYNVGGGHEVENVVLTREILRLTGKPDSLIRRCASSQPGSSPAGVSQ